MSHLPRPPRALAVVAALTLGACAAVGPDFKPPATPEGPAAAGYAMSGDPTPATLALSPQVRAAGPWWQALGSPALDQTVRLALSDSPTLAEADATLARARAETDAAAGRRLPEIEGNASLLRKRVNTQALGFSGFPSPTVTLYSIGTDVTYDLDLFGGRRRAVERAAAAAEAAQRRADAAYLTLSGQVALQAIRVAGLRAEIAALRQVADDDRRVVDLVRRAEKAGGEAPAAIVQADAQLAEDEALLPPLLRELDAARHQLAVLSGKAPAIWAAPDFELADFAAPTSVPVSLPSELVRQRPDIRAAEADLHAATAAVGVATARLYPDISLTAAFAQTTRHPRDIFNYSASGWAFGPELTAPIFNGGALRAERRGAEADARVALARYQQTVLKAFGEVSDALSAIARDDDALAAQRRAAASAEANARNAQSAYRLGGGALMQVVDAQRTLSRVRRGLAQAEAQRLADLVRLFTATAADWRTPT